MRLRQAKIALTLYYPEFQVYLRAIYYTYKRRMRGIKSVSGLRWKVALLGKASLRELSIRIIRVSYAAIEWYIYLIILAPGVKSCG